MALAAANMVVIKQRMAKDLFHLREEMEQLESILSSRCRREQTAKHLHGQYVQAKIRLRIQLFKYIEVFQYFLTSVRRITDNRNPDLTLLALFKRDSIVVKLVDEAQLLMVRLGELRKVDTVARRFLCQPLNHAN
jgi:hypothetical protein